MKKSLNNYLFYVISSIISIFILFENSNARITVRFLDNSYISNEAMVYYNKFLNQYETTLNNLTESAANGFAFANTLWPILGNPYKNFATGLNATLVSSNLPEGTGKDSILKTINNIADFTSYIPGELVTGISEGVFASFSLKSLNSLFGVSFFNQSDITFKIFHNKMLPFNKKEFLETFLAGLIYNKQIVSEKKLMQGISFTGLSLSFGVHYSDYQCKTSVSNIESPETIYIDNGKVLFSPKYSLIDIKIKSFVLDSEIKGYINLINFLDIFAGGGLSWNIYNKMTVHSSLFSTIGLITPDGTTASHDGYEDIDVYEGYIMIDGKENYTRIIPKILGGFQLNFGPVKIPIQFSLGFASQNLYGISAGVMLLF